jgi:hypothetical protein
MNVSRHALASRLSSRTLILGLESSADDTCAAVVSENGILSNIVIKQPFHEQYGGIFPTKASHAHAENFPRAVREALRDAQVTLKDLSAIAWTRGPGLVPCLAASSLLGRSLAASLDIPSIGVHHMVRSRSLLGSIEASAASTRSHSVLDRSSARRVSIPHMPGVRWAYPAHPGNIEQHLQDSGHDS